MGAAFQINDYRTKLNMSVVNFEGTHNPTKREGEEVGYQERKKHKTSSMLI